MDPEVYCSTFMDPSIKCPLDGCGQKMERNGLGTLRIARSFTTRVAVLACETYACRNCKAAKEGCSTSSFPVWDPRLVATFPPAVQSSFDCVMGKAAIMAVDALALMMALRMRGVSFNAMEAAGREVWASHAARVDVQLLAVACHDAVNPPIASYMTGAGGDGSENGLSNNAQSGPANINISSLLTGNVMLGRCVLMAARMKDALLADYERTRRVLEAGFYNNLRYGPRLQLDHAFLHGLRPDDAGRYAFAHVLTSSGQVVYFGALPTKSLTDISTYLGFIAQGAKEVGVLLEAVFTDHPEADEALLRSCTQNWSLKPDGPAILMDVFHLIYDLGRHLSAKHTMRAEALGALSDAFFVAVDATLKAHAARLRGSGISDLEIGRRLQSRSYVRACKEILRTLREPAEINARMDAWLAKYATVGIFLEGAMSKFARIKKLVEGGFVSDLLDQSPCFINVGDAECPVYRVLRGTNGCENFHRILRIVDVASSGESLSNALYSLTAHRYSQNQRVSTLGHDIPSVYDPSLLNSLSRSVAAAKRNSRINFIAEHPCAGWRVLEPNETPAFFKVEYGLGAVSPSSQLGVALSETRARDLEERDVWAEAADELNFETLDLSTARPRRDVSFFEAFPMPPARAVETETEKRLVRRLVWANLKSNVASLSAAAVWGLIARGDLDTVVDVALVARTFNILYLDGFSSTENHDVVFGSEKFLHRDLRAKEVTHLRAFLNQYAQAVVHRAANPDGPQPIDTRVAPLPNNAVVHARADAITLPSIPVVAAHAARLAAAVAAAAQPSHVAPAALVGAPPLRDAPARSAAAAAAEVAAKVAAAAAARSAVVEHQPKRVKPGANIPCPHCKRAKHGAESGCALKAWMDRQPSIERPSRKWSTRDVVRKLYNEDGAFRAAILAEQLGAVEAADAAVAPCEEGGAGHVADGVGPGAPAAV